MNWWTYFRQHGQRPGALWRVATPSYWQQVNRERQATAKIDHQRIPCGQCVTTKFVDTTGQVIRQDISITIGHEALKG